MFTAGNVSPRDMITPELEIQIKSTSSLSLVLGPSCGCFRIRYSLVAASSFANGLPWEIPVAADENIQFKHSLWRSYKIDAQPNAVLTGGDNDAKAPD